MKQVGIVLMIFFLSLFVNAENYCWTGIIVDVNGKPIENAHLKVQKNDKVFLFVSDKGGKIEVSYTDYQNEDSVLISCVGYQSFRGVLSNLSQGQIVLDYKSIMLDEFIIKKDVKPVVLGNKKNNTLMFPSSQLYESTVGLFIPNEGVRGEIRSVRVYLRNRDGNNWKYRPFRINLLEGEVCGKEFGDNLLNKEIIASLKVERNWVEVDIEDFGIELSEQGITVGIQALPYDYYLDCGYIDSSFVVPENGKQRDISAICVGHTRRRKNSKVVPYIYYNEVAGWKKQDPSYMTYMIQLVVEEF